MGISIDGAIDGLKLSSLGGTTPGTVLSRESISIVMGILINRSSTVLPLFKHGQKRLPLPTAEQ